MKVKVDQKTVDDFQAAANFPSGTLVESRNGKQYLVMAGDNFQPVLVSLENNRVYGTNKIAGAGGSNSYRKILFSQIVLEADWQREESMSGKTSDTRCPKCREPLKEILYPYDCMLNRDQWKSQLAGDLFCTCHNNGRGHQPYAYFWKYEFEPTPPEGEADPLSPLLDMSVVEGLSEELRKAKAEG